MEDDNVGWILAILFAGVIGIAIGYSIPKNKNKSS